MCVCFVCFVCVCVLCVVCVCVCVCFVRVCARFVSPPVPRGGGVTAGFRVVNSKVDKMCDPDGEATSNPNKSAILVWSLR